MSSNTSPNFSATMSNATGNSHQLNPHISQNVKVMPSNSFPVASAYHTLLISNSVSNSQHQYSSLYGSEPKNVQNSYMNPSFRNNDNQSQDLKVPVYIDNQSGSYASSNVSYHRFYNI
jgi:hypothetical protein